MNEELSNGPRNEAFNELASLGPGPNPNHQIGRLHGRVESFGGTAKYVDLRPETEVSEIPVLVAGGWVAGSRALGQVGETIRASGRRAILVDHARSGDIPELIEPPRQEAHKANTFLSILDELKIDKTDVIAHSEGALNAVIAALQQPERFRSITLVAPAGMIGEDSFFALSKRFMPVIARAYTKDLVDNPKASFNGRLNNTIDIAKNPHKALNEVQDIADTTIDQVLDDLRAKGIRIFLIQSNSDPVFPNERMEKHVSLDEKNGNVDAYAEIAAEDAGHNDLEIHPERTASAALQMIEELDEELAQAA